MNRFIFFLVIVAVVGLAHGCFIKECKGNCILSYPNNGGCPTCECNIPPPPPGGMMCSPPKCKEDCGIDYSTEPCPSCKC
nr:small proline-rich protein 2H-like [Parasteatoda tepidariorum]